MIFFLFKHKTVFFWSLDTLNCFQFFIADDKKELNGHRAKSMDKEKKNVTTVLFATIVNALVTDL